MERQSVKSSNIQSMGHDGDKLHVEFKGGKVFEYEGVSREQFDEMMGAKSIGSHFARNIRNSHNCKPVQ